MDQANIRKAVRGYIVTAVYEGSPFGASTKEVIFEDLFDALAFLAHQLADNAKVDIADGPLVKKGKEDCAEDCASYSAYKAKYDSVFRRRK
jgi:hypothetical protein